MHYVLFKKKTLQPILSHLIAMQTTTIYILKFQQMHLALWLYFYCMLVTTTQHNYIHEIKVHLFVY